MVSQTLTEFVWPLRERGGVFLKKTKKNYILRLATLLPGVPLEHSHPTYKHGSNLKSFLRGFHKR